MIIKFYGHSFFTLETESGIILATDPYGDFYQYPKRAVKANYCTVSHHHHDHDGLSCLIGMPKVIDTVGRHELADGMIILGVQTAHDEQGGALRGPNVFFVVMADGLRIGHAGDLGHVPTPEQLSAIGSLDILFLPVGGFYTIDANTALQTMRLLSPRLTIPMHYRTRFNPDMPVSSLDTFEALLDHPLERMPLLRVAKEDLSEQPSVAALLPQA